MEAEAEGRSLRSQDLNSEKNCINHDQIGNVWHTSGLLEKGWIKKYGYKGRGRDMLGEFVISWVLSSAKIWNNRPTLQLDYSSEFYSASKGTYTLEARGQADLEGKANRREARGPILAPLFKRFFSSPWAYPMQTGLARRAVCFTWGSHSSPPTFLCSIFVGFPLLRLLATAILDSFFLF